MAPVRLAHFSDIHVVAPARWRLGDVFSKRLSTWANFRLLGRAAQFLESEPVLAALRADLAERSFDHLVFSGDATAMGFETEVARAAGSLPLTVPGLAVPGNHDYCTPAAMRSGAFERHFAPWQHGDRIDAEVYPFAQRVGPVWLIGVNSATGNRLPRDARGRVGRPQLERLRELLTRLDGGPRVLVTHYPVARRCGSPEEKLHCLRDVADLLAVARAGGVDLWLHGHRHDVYHHPKSATMPVASICAGSATQTGLWSYQEIAIEGRRLTGCVRTYEGDASSRGEGMRWNCDRRTLTLIGHRCTYSHEAVRTLIHGKRIMQSPPSISPQPLRSNRVVLIRDGVLVRQPRRLARRPSARSRKMSA